MMGMRAVGAVGGAIVLLTACGQTSGVPTTAGSDYKLYEMTSQHRLISVIDSRSHATERTLPLGTASPDWKHLYSMTSAGLSDLDPATGATLHVVNLPGSYQLPPASLSGLPGGLSQDGEWLVLQGPGAAGDVLPSSHFVVVDTSYRKALERVDLQGRYDFDAISNDGRRMYLIEHVTDAIYRVMYDLAASRMDPGVVFDKTDGTEAMAGLRLSGVANPDGTTLYSVYIRQHDRPFVHALGLGGTIAFCIELAGGGYASGNGDAEFQWSLALSPDAKTLYAVNPALGLVSAIDTGSNQVVHTAQLEHAASSSNPLVESVQAKELGANASLLTPDGRTLVIAGDSGVAWLDTSTLQVRHRALSGWHVWSLGLSPEGGTLFALSDSGRFAEVSMASGSAGATFDSGAGYPLAIMRVAAA
jgi:hypothetical protein